MKLCDVKDNVVPIFIKDPDDTYEKYRYLKEPEIELRTESTIASYEESPFDDPVIYPDEPEEEEIPERGFYEQFALKYSPTELNDMANSVIVLGEPVVGNTLRCVDHPDLVNKFPIDTYQWYASIEHGINNKFDPTPISCTDTLLIEPYLVGKYVCCKTRRIVEKQISMAADNYPKTNVYDPHVKIDIEQQGNFAHAQLSVAIGTTGPVLISDEQALFLLEHLVKAELSLNVTFHIREDILALCGEFRYKHLYMSGIDSINGRLSVDLKSLKIEWSKDGLSEKTKEAFDIFGIGGRLKFKIRSVVFKRSDQHPLIIETKSQKLEQPYIIEVDCTESEELRDSLYYICACYQMSSVYMKTGDDWNNYLSEGNLDIVKYFVCNILSR